MSHYLKKPGLLGHSNKSDLARREEFVKRHSRTPDSQGSKKGNFRRSHVGVRGK